VGWAMFATVATTATVSLPGPQRRGRAVSLLLMSETSGLLLGSAAGGWLYQGIGVSSPFLFEAACMVVAAITVGHWASLAAAPSRQRLPDRRVLGTVLRTPGVVLMGVTSALLTAIQTGILVFLSLSTSSHTRVSVQKPSAPSSACTCSGGSWPYG
jgi:predicted MFS family arabinose efflux permease